MKLRTVWIFGAGCLLAACGAKETAAPAGSADAGVKGAAADAPVATSRQVMLGLTIPASDVLFQVGTKPPEDDAAWDRVSANAVMLAESARMLLVAPRNIDQPEWAQQANDLMARAKQAADAAAKHDVDAVLAAGDAIYETCDACHNKYMPAKVAEQAAAAK